MSFLEQTHVPGKGPIPAAIAVVGEAPGLNEELYKTPFVGPAGDELRRMFKEVGLDWTQTYATNVFKIRPPDTERSNNDIQSFFAKRGPGDPRPVLPPFAPGKHVLLELEPMVRGLIGELNMVGAPFVIALGGTALWGLLGKQKITSFVGTVHPPEGERRFTVIPTYHPAAVLRQFNFRTTALANLAKVKRLAGAAHSERQVLGKPVGGNSSAPKFNIKINPTLAEVEAFAARCQRPSVTHIAIDVETAHGQIRTISFSIGPREAFVIPFWEPPRTSYWPTMEGERRAWAAVARICATPATKIFHNGPYDIQYIWRVHGIPINGPIEDTMSFAHAMEPELPRTLGFLAATYLEMPEWKTMRLKSEKEEE